MTNDQARDYAWEHFKLHAAQRFTTFNFFIVLAVLMTTGHRPKQRFSVPRTRRVFEHPDLTSSPNGNDDSWIQWDVAKQLDFFVGKNRSKTNIHYRIADPFNDKTLQDEIISRQIGWGFYHANGPEPWASNPEVRRLLGQPKKDGRTRASWALAQLGALIRAG